MANDNNGNPADSLLTSMVETTLETEPASRSNSPKDTFGMRVVKYASIIVVPAVVLGIGFLFYAYIDQYRSETAAQRSRATRKVAHDSVGAMKFRFWMGASIGGGLGMIYVVRCIVRKVDP